MIRNHTDIEVWIIKVFVNVIQNFSAEPGKALFPVTPEALADTEKTFRVQPAHLLPPLKFTAEDAVKISEPVITINEYVKQSMSAPRKVMRAEFMFPLPMLIR
jgi:hypothetical protein